LSTRATNALDHANLLTVAELLQFPLSEIPISTKSGWILLTC
jgi:hypothetical protein